MSQGCEHDTFREGWVTVRRPVRYTVDGNGPPTQALCPVADSPAQSPSLCPGQGVTIAGSPSGVALGAVPGDSSVPAAQELERRLVSGPHGRGRWVSEHQPPMTTWPRHQEYLNVGMKTTLTAFNGRAAATPGPEPAAARSPPSARGGGGGGTWEAQEAAAVWTPC